MRKIKRICGPPQTRRGRPAHIRVLSAALTAFFTASVFAYAGGIEATTNTFVSKLLSKFSGILLDICDMLVSPIFSITTMTVDEIAAYIPGFNTASGTGDFFVQGIQLIGSCIASCLAMLGILKIIIGLARDEKVGSIGSLIWRMAIFIPLTIFGQKFLRGLFNRIISPVSAALASGVLGFSNDHVFATVANPLTGDASQLATMIVGTILMVMIGYNLIGLVLEAAERYLICIVIIFLSPLAFAAGVGEETANVAKNWLKMFWSHGVLLILNIWVVGIGRTCFDALDPSATPTQVIVWALITYAYFKVAQKLDDMMQNSGLMVTRTGGDFVHDATLAVGTLAATSKHLFGGAADTVVAGAGVANAVKAGAGIGDIAKPIANYAKAHPFLAPTAGVAAAVAGGTTGFANQAAAAHALTHTTDAARAASMAGGTGAKQPDVNTQAYRTAAHNQLVQAGFEGAKGGKVDSLTANADGTLSGVLTQRDAAGRVQSQTGFTMSNATGTKEGVTATAGRQVSIGADGKSATIVDPQAGTFSLQQTGTDKYGNQVWEATRTASGGGAAMAGTAVAKAATEAFSFKADGKSRDGIGAQAANSFMSGGTMDTLTQRSDEAIAHQAKQDAEKASALKDLNTMSDADRVAQMRDENSSVNYSSEGYRAATAEYMQQNGLDGGMVERGGEIVAQTVAEDGRLVGCMAIKDADGNVQEEKFYALSTQAAEAPAMGDGEGAAPGGAEPPAADGPVYAYEGSTGTSETPAMASAPEIMPGSDDMGASAYDMQDEGGARAGGANAAAPSYSAPQQAAESDDGDDDFPAMVTTGTFSGGESASAPAAYNVPQQTFDGEDIPQSAPTAAGGYAETAFTGSVTQPQETVEQAPPVVTVQPEPGTVSAPTATLDEVLTARYQMMDEGHGMVETSDLGKLQVNRVSVDETTGDTKWQIIRKGDAQDFSDPDGEEAVISFERRGNRGVAQTFKDVIRDIRNTRNFDQLALIDSKNKERPDDSHLFR